MNSGLYKALKNIVETYYSHPVPLHVKGEPWKVVIGCILSQRTRDETTDRAFERLFSRYRTLEELASADVNEVEKLIYPVGFYRQKAKRIVEAAKYMLVHGVKPGREELMKIPGVGRKCANIVLAFAFKKPAIAVDTHVERIVKRLGLVDKKASPEEVEKVLENIFPEEEWVKVNHALVRFGQNVCKPVRPLCNTCTLKTYCKFYNSNIQ